MKYQKIRSDKNNTPPAGVNEKLLSVIIPVYNEETNLQQMFDELHDILNKVDMKYEVIFVDDGSNDGSWDLIARLHRSYDTVKGLRFSRNFGHQYALYAGYSYASGDAVISMDGDLQHPPDLIPEMLEKWKEGTPIVETVRIELQSLSIFKRIASKYFYKLFSFLSGVPLRSGMADFRLLDRHALDSILEFGEQGLFLRGIVGSIGFPRASISYQCRDRYSGETKYTLRKMVRFGIEGITSFSIIPLRLGIVIGIVTSLVSFLLVGYAIYVYAIGESVPGWATIIAATSFMFGILFILLGLIGEYIGRILIEVRKRPRFILNETLGLHHDRPEKIETPDKVSYD